VTAHRRFAANARPHHHPDGIRQSQLINLACLNNKSQSHHRTRPEFTCEFFRQDFLLVPPH
jgi:hypothetical protein